MDSSTTPEHKDTAQEFVPGVSGFTRTVRRNSVPYIGRLPDEILGKIYLIVMALSMCGSHTSYRYQYLYRWIYITQVCRRWYNVATRLSALWSQVVIPSNNQLITLLLERSREASLCITYDDANVQLDEETVEILHSTLARHLHHIRKLSLSIAPEAYETVRDTFSQPAPKLETLQICTRAKERPLPQVYLDHEMMPSLKVFRSSSGFRVSWEQLSRMTTLQVLDLSCDYGSDAIFMLSRVLDALAGMPLLQTLRLRGFKVLLDGSARTISLDNLAECNLASTPATCSALLQHIRTPSDLQLTIMYAAIREEDLSSLAMPLLTKLTGSTTLDSPAPLTGISVSITGPDAVALNAYPRNPDSWKIRLQIPFGVRYLDHLFKALAPSLQSVQELDVSLRNLAEAPEIFSVAHFVWLSSFMPNVTTLRCAYWSVPNYVAGLCNMHSTPHVERTRFAWPSLKTLVLQFVPFSVDGRFFHGDSGYDVQCVTLLREGLMKRQSSGCTMLNCLVIRMCRLKESDLKMLEDCCGEVVCEHNHKI
ncbi:hypothetical protein NM688_g4861 [Phlebia brevispora]|uniref:Uncharacterized protein n=1 Tax=Phlebia brevispora TaxID=194682 RepID=A0ACC1T1G1_9APHY|nr:hypothetical protein NM688_g4861 [Phlebia brevispora]